MLRNLDVAHETLGIMQKVLWIDYCSVRLGSYDWTPKHVIDRIGRMEFVVVLLGDDFDLLTRSWCILEVFAAAATHTKLVCHYESGWENEASQLRYSGVTSENAQSHRS